MHVRPVEPEEVPEMEALWKNAYRVDSATARAWAEGTDLATTRAIMAEGRVQSLIKILPYEVLVGGRPVPMGGIGGVATWADLQGRGLAGRLLTYSVREMRRLGYAVSFLYPFAHRWYARYGWETAGRAWVYSGFSPGSLPPSRDGVRVRAVRTEKDFGQVRQVYEAISPRYNGMVRRTDCDWNALRHASQSVDRAQFYVIADEKAAGASGYFLATDRLMEGGYEVTLREYLCADDAAYRALFGFLSTLPANVRSIRILAPEFPSLWNYFREPTVTTQVQPTFQARVVDVAAACRGRGWPEGAEEDLVFAVTDEHGPWNTATWRLTLKNGTATIARSNRRAKLSLTIHQFSGIYMGFLDPVAEVDLGRLPESARPVAKGLRSLFHDRPTALLDLF